MASAVVGWDRWREAFAALLDPRFYTPEWLDEEIAMRRIVLLQHDDAAVLVKIKAYPTGALELHGMAAVGNMETIVSKLIPDAEEWGWRMGCCVATIESRSGWERVLKPMGYSLYQTALRKDLCHGAE